MNKLFAVIGIIVISIGFGVLGFVINVQSQCESLPDDLQDPMTSSFWGCMYYLDMANSNQEMASITESMESKELVKTFTEKYSQYEITEFPDSNQNIWKYSVDTGDKQVELIFGKERTVLRAFDDSQGICTVINPFPQDIIDNCPPKW